MTAPPTRIAGLPRVLVALLGLLAAAFVLWSALPSPAPPPRIAKTVPGKPESAGDLALYGGIVAAMQKGADYYPTAVAAQRAGNYPLKPFFAVRLPTLATLQSSLPPSILVVALWLMVIAVIVAWGWRVRDAFASRSRAAIAGLLLAGGLAAFMLPTTAWFHEIWAAPLVALSLALWRADRLPWASLGCAAAALVIRETAVILPLAMIAAALLERRMREAALWLALLGAFAVVLALHANALAPLLRAGDLVSPGWSGLLGWGFVVDAVSLSSVLRLAPGWLAGALLASSLVGWAGWRDRRGLRVIGTLIGYALFIGLFGRPDTFYWALMPAPLALMGLVFLPPLLTDGARAFGWAKERA